jgi:imidazolonepropionase-like amidohydrolase
LDIVGVVRYWLPYAEPEEGAPADTVVLHAQIYTVSSNHPWATALAIRKGTIIAVGSENAIEAHRGPSTQVVKATRHTVLPGFTDTLSFFVWVTAPYPGSTRRGR